MAKFTLDGFKLGQPNLRAAKLSPESVVQIKHHIRAGVSDYELAKMYDVSETTIRSIRTGRTWFHIKEEE